MARKINLNTTDLFYKLGTPSASPRSTTALSLTQSTRRASSQDSSTHVQSPNFSKQLPRTYLKTFTSDVHEKRFVAFQTFPSISSRVPRISVPDISRATGRTFLGIYKDTQVDKVYSPNYKAVWKGSGKELLKFEVSLGRKPLHNPRKLVPEVRDVNYKQVDANIAVPNIEKTSSRPNEKEVPAFMVGVHYLDRVSGHNAPNFKSLQMSNFMNTNFMPLTSTFGQRDRKSKSVMRPGKDLSSLSVYD